LSNLLTSKRDLIQLIIKIILKIMDSKIVIIEKLNYLLIMEMEMKIILIRIVNKMISKLILKIWITFMICFKNLLLINQEINLKIQIQQYLILWLKKKIYNLLIKEIVYLQNHKFSNNLILFKVKKQLLKKCKISFNN